MRWRRGKRECWCHRFSILNPKWSFKEAKEKVQFDLGVNMDFLFFIFFSRQQCSCTFVLCHLHRLIQLSVYSSISYHACCQRCQHCNNSVGCWWICHHVIHVSKLFSPTWMSGRCGADITHSGCVVSPVSHCGRHFWLTSTSTKDVFGPGFSIILLLLTRLCKWSMYQVDVLAPLINAHVLCLYLL